MGIDLRVFQSSSVNVRVKVIDENDNIPTFTKSLYLAAISENMTIGSSVLQVSASDPDEGSNGDIVYTLRGTDGMFAINSTSGNTLVILSKVIFKPVKQFTYSSLVKRANFYKWTPI